MGEALFDLRLCERLMVLMSHCLVISKVIKINEVQGHLTVNSIIQIIV